MGHQAPTNEVFSRAQNIGGWVMFFSATGVLISLFVTLWVLAATLAFLAFLGGWVLASTRFDAPPKPALTRPRTELTELTELEAAMSRAGIRSLDADDTPEQAADLETARRAMLGSLTPQAYEHVVSEVLNGRRLRTVADELPDEDRASLGAAAPAVSHPCHDCGRESMPDRLRCLACHDIKHLRQQLANSYRAQKHAAPQVPQGVVRDLDRPGDVPADALAELLYGFGIELGHGRHGCGRSYGG
jgi:hypothetical protein